MGGPPSGRRKKEEREWPSPATVDFTFLRNGFIFGLALALLLLSVVLVYGMGSKSRVDSAATSVPVGDSSSWNDSGSSPLPNEKEAARSESQNVQLPARADPYVEFEVMGPVGGQQSSTTAAGTPGANESTTATEAASSVHPTSGSTTVHVMTTVSNATPTTEQTTTVPRSSTPAPPAVAGSTTAGTSQVTTSTSPAPTNMTSAASPSTKDNAMVTSTTIVTTSSGGHETMYATASLSSEGQGRTVSTTAEYEYETITPTSERVTATRSHSTAPETTTSGSRTVTAAPVTAAPITAAPITASPSTAEYEYVTVNETVPGLTSSSEGYEYENVTVVNTITTPSPSSEEYEYVTVTPAAVSAAPSTTAPGITASAVIDGVSTSPVTYEYETITAEPLDITASPSSEAYEYENVTVTTVHVGASSSFQTYEYETVTAEPADVTASQSSEAYEYETFTASTVNVSAGPNSETYEHGTLTAEPVSVTASPTYDYETITAEPLNITTSPSSEAYDYVSVTETTTGASSKRTEGSSIEEYETETDTSSAANATVGTSKGYKGTTTTGTPAPLGPTAATGRSKASSVTTSVTKSGRTAEPQSTGSPVSAHDATTIPPVTGPTSKPWFPTQFELCNTSFCSAEGADISQSFSSCCDPCDNFYGYVCRKVWPTVVQDFDYSDSDSMLSLEIEMKVKSVLDGSSPGTSSPLVNLWRGCQASSSTPLPLDLQATFKSLGFDHQQTHPTPDFVLEATGDIVVNLGTWPLLFFEMNRDPADNTQWILALDEPDILVSPQQIKRNAVKVKTGFSSMACEYARLIFGQPDVQFCDLVTDTAITIAGASTLHFHPARRAGEYEIMLYPQLGPLHPLLVKVMGPNFPLNNLTRIMVKSPVYVQTKLIPLLTKRPIPLYDYVGFHTMVSLAPFLGVDSLFEMSLFALTGKVWKNPPKWRVCLHLINKVLPSHMTVAYQKPFEDATQFEEVMGDVMAEEVRTAFLDQITNLRFLDAWTRNIVKMKVKHTHVYSFFPLHLSTADNVVEYTKKINTAVPPNSNALVYFLDVSKYVAGIWKTHGRLRYFHQRWKGSVFDTTCQYVLSENTIYIPAGLFNVSIPTSTKEKMFHIPRVGSRIAECLFRATFESAAFYGPNELSWTEYSRGEYEEKLRCFGNQYKFERHEISDVYTGIEDNAAIRVSYNVFQDQLFTLKYFHKDYRLPDMSNTTSRQLFFIYYARSYCQNLPADSDERADVQNRVNVPLKNSEEFSEAFNCPFGSDMNPVDKCRVWE